MLKETVNTFPGLPCLQSVVVCPFIKTEESIDLLELGSKAIFLSEFLEKSEQKEDSNCEELAFEQVDFDHPLFVMFSSGTTGAPKAMVHSVGVNCRFSLFCTWFRTIFRFERVTYFSPSFFTEFIVPLRNGVQNTCGQHFLIPFLMYFLKPVCVCV